MRPSAVMPYSREDAEQYWLKNPPKNAFEIVRAGFAPRYVHQLPGITTTGFNIRLIAVFGNATEDVERRVIDALSPLGWQLIIVSLLDKSRYRPARVIVTGHGFSTGANLYGVAPIESCIPRPEIVYHATENWRIPLIRKQGLKCNRDEVRYADTRDKIYVCPILDDGSTTCAAYWAKLLSESDQVPIEAFSILEVDLRTSPSARVYQDLHSQSGIVIDGIDSIPSDAILREYVLRNGQWIAKGSGN